MINFITAPTGKIYSGAFFDEVESVSTRKVVAFEGDPIADTISWSSIDPEIVESAGTLYLALRRTGSATSPGSVIVTTSPGSAGAADFTALSTTASWGTSTGIIYVPITLTDDSDAEGDETFTVTLSSATGAALSGPAGITVTLIDDEKDPGIITHPASLSVKEGEGAIFAVAVDSPIPPSYEWFRDGVPIPGAISSTYSIPSSSPSDEADYTVTISIPGYSVTSNPATLTIISPAAVVDPAYVPTTDLYPSTLTVLPDSSVLTYEGRFIGINNLRKLDPSGVVDPSFAPVVEPLPGFTNLNPRFFPLPSGKLLFTGFFRSIDGVVRPLVALLNADGSIDPSFDAGMSDNPAIGSNAGTAVTSSGDIYVRYRLNGTAGEITRRNLDGSIDPSFSSSIGTGLNGRIRSLIELPDGSLLISHLTGGGSFIQGITRLNSDGSAFSGFTPIVGESTNTELVLLPGDRFAVGSGSRIFIYDLSGALLETFTFTGNFTSLAYHQGRLIFTGPSDYEGTTIPGIGRLSLEGVLDDNFPGGSGPNNAVTHAGLDGDGRLVAIGSFTTWNGLPRDKFARLLIESPEVGFLSSTSTALEDNSPHQVQLVRYGDNTDALSVRVTSSNDTASSPSDFTAIDQVITWAAGDSASKSLEITLIDDASADGDLSFSLSLSEASGGVIVTSNHTVTIRDDDSLPSIASQPDDVFTLEGSSGDFSISVSSPSPLSYQWYFNGEPIVGATSDTYSLASVTPAEEGAYSVLITNDYDSIWSESASLIIVEPPLNVADGYTPTLTFGSTIWAVATAPDGGAYVGGDFLNLNGDATKDYLAKVNPDGSLAASFNPDIDSRVVDIVVQDDGKILVGGNFNNVDGIQSRDLARFNPDGSADTAFNTNIGSGSNSRVEGIDLLPDGKIIVAGSFSSWSGTSLSPRRDILRLNQDGTLDIAYERTSSSPNVYDVKALPSGEVLVCYNTTNALAAKVQRFTTDGSLDSSFDYSSGRLRVRRIAIASDGDYLFAGNQTLKINPDGSTDTDFTTTNGNDVREQVNGKVIFAERQIHRYLPSGNADPIFPSSFFNGDIQRLDLRDDGKIWVVGSFTNFSGTSPTTFASRIILLNGDPIPIAITRQPANIIQDPGTTAVFSIKATGTSAISYQWKKNGVNLVDGGDISGAQTDTLTLQSISDPDAGDYTCTITNDSGNETSDAAQLIVLGIPVFLTQPEDLTSLAGNSATLTAEAVGAGAVTYQWYRNGSPLSDGGAISGSTSDTLNISPATESDSGNYLLRATNGLGFTGSDEAVVVINANPAAIASGYTAPTFNWGEFYAILPLDGGGVLAGGSFLNSAEGWSNLLVIEDDGSVRNTPVTANSPVRVLLEDANGKYLVAGDFTQLNGTAVNRVARLNSDFSIDNTFDVGAGPNSSVYDLRIDENGKMIVSGFFNSWNGDANFNFVVRINDNGTLDNTFTSVANTFSYQGIPLPGGDVLTGGAVFNADGNGATTFDNYLFRMNNDGSIDPGFAGEVSFFAPTKVFIDSLNRVYSNSGTGILNRFDIDGAPEPGYDNALFNGATNSIFEDSSGRLLFGGLFTQLYGNDQPRLVRLNSDDSVDESFGVGTGPNNNVMTIAEASDGSIWIGGSFTEYNGVPMARILRLQGDSSSGNNDPFLTFLEDAGIPAGERGPNDDPDGDRRSNLLEFLESTNPGLRDWPGYHLNPINTTGGGTWINDLAPGANLDPNKRYRVAYYNIPKDTKGVGISVQASLNLNAMDDGSAQAIEFGTPVDNGTYETRSFYILPSASDTPRIFWRLNLSQPE